VMFPVPAPSGPLRRRRVMRPVVAVVQAVRVGATDLPAEIGQTEGAGVALKGRLSRVVPKVRPNPRLEPHRPRSA
jgi:hypothetical protein